VVAAVRANLFAYATQALRVHGAGGSWRGFKRIALDVSPGVRVGLIRCPKENPKFALFR